MKWYNALQDATNKHIDNVLYHVRTIITGYNDGTKTLDSLNNEPTSRATQSTTTLVSPNNESTPLTIHSPAVDAVDDDPEPLLADTRPPPVTMVEIEDEDAFTNVGLSWPSTPLKSSTAPPSTPIPWKRRHSEDTDGLRDPFPMPIPRDRPSDYLRSRCPLCFGGDPNQRLGGDV